MHAKRPIKPNFFQLLVKNFLAEIKLGNVEAHNATLVNLKFLFENIDSSFNGHLTYFIFKMF